MSERKENTKIKKKRKRRPNTKTILNEAIKEISPEERAALSVTDFNIFYPHDFMREMERRQQLGQYGSILFDPVYRRLLRPVENLNIFAEARKRITDPYILHTLGLGHKQMDIAHTNYPYEANLYMKHISKEFITPMIGAIDTIFQNRHPIEIRKFINIRREEREINEKLREIAIRKREIDEEIEKLKIEKLKSKEKEEEQEETAEEEPQILETQNWRNPKGPRNDTGEGGGMGGGGISV